MLVTIHFNYAHVLIISLDVLVFFFVNNSYILNVPFWYFYMSINNKSLMMCSGNVRLLNAHNFVGMWVVFSETCIHIIWHSSSFMIMGEMFCLIFHSDIYTLYNYIVKCQRVVSPTLGWLIIVFISSQNITNRIYWHQTCKVNLWYYMYIYWYLVAFIHLISITCS